MYGKTVTALLLIVLATAQPLAGQDNISLPSMKNDGPEGIMVLTERLFTSESLFGYMNGGAELYLEYGFDTLLVSEIEWEGESFKVEIFDMAGVEEAFGIYSVSLFRCDKKGVVTPVSCLTQYQLQLCKGDTYVNVINNSGSEKGSGMALQIGEWLAERLYGETFDPALFIPGELPPGYNRLVLVKGPIGSYNGAPEWEQLFRDLPHCTALITTTEEGVTIVLRADTPEAAENLQRYLEQESLPSNITVRKQVTSGAVLATGIM